MINNDLILTAIDLEGKTVIFKGSDGKFYSFDYISYVTRQPRIYCGYGTVNTYEQLTEIIADGNGILKEIDYKY